MSYTISVQVYQTNPNAFFHIVEETVFTDGYWEEIDGRRVLKMGSSGTSGSLRFLADSGESFIVTLGVHNYKPWGDIVTGLNNRQTGVVINSEYYEREWNGTNNPERVAVRWKTLSSQRVSRSGRSFSFKYTVTSGHNLKAEVIIG